MSTSFFTEPARKKNRLNIPFILQFYVNLVSNEEY